MSEKILYQQKKYNKSIFLIIFGIIFYLFINDKNNFEWLYSAIQPVLSAFIIAYLLDPLVKFLCRKLKIRREFSILIVLTGLIMFFVFLIFIAIPSLVANANDLINKLPTIDQINNNILKIFSGFDRENSVAITEFVNSSLKDSLLKFGAIATSLLENFVSNIFLVTSKFFSVIISIVIAIYMLLDKEDLIARIKRFIYAYRKNEDADYLIDIARRSNEIFSNFFIGKIIDSIIIGILCFIILLIAQIPYASIISLVIGVTNVIPYFGPFIGGVPAVIITFLVDPTKGLWLALIILILQQFDGLYLGPKILGHKVGVGAFWIITSVTVGGILMGVWGMFLGVPAIVLVKSIVEQSVSSKLQEKNMEDFEKEHLK